MRRLRPWGLANALPHEGRTIAVEQQPPAARSCFAATTRREFATLVAILAGVSAHAGAAEPQPTNAIDITGDDIAWLRRGRAVWARLESGAPAIVPPDVDAQAYIDGHLAYSTPGSSARKPERLEPILCAFFLNATFLPGRYDLDPPVAEIGADGAPSGSVSSTIEVTTDHLTLLKHSLWNGPLMDGKRPYGTRSFYEADMAELLGHRVPKGADGEIRLPDAEQRRDRTMHHAMLAVVQAYIQHAQFEPGGYVVPRDGWAAPFHPLCRPVTSQQVADYQAFCASHPRVAGSSVLGLWDLGSIDRIMRATTAEFWAKAALFEPS